MSEEPQKEKEEVIKSLNSKNSSTINKYKKFQIQFDILKILSIIKKDGSYKEDNIIFELYKKYTPTEYEESDDTPKYMVDIKSDQNRYLGILSKSLRKELYGYSLYDNGDEYFGQWNSDEKSGFGIYYFKENDTNKINHVYIGEFSENKKNGEGLYFKVNKFEEEKEKENRPGDFVFEIGYFSEDYFQSGVIYSIEGEKRKIYKGKMNNKGEKNDDNAEIYENGNQIFYGCVKNNIMINGRIIVLKKGENDFEKDEAYYFERKEDKNHNDDIDFDYRKGEENDESLIKKMKEIFDIYDCEKLKELYMKVIDLREKIKSPDNFQYMKDLDFDVMVKEELKKLYGKYIFMD